MTWAIVVVAGVAGLVYVLAPLTRPARRGLDRTGGLQTELDARKRSALLGIVDLEGELEVGKLTTEDFATLRSEYEAEAMVAIAELDQLGGGGQDELEREIARLKARLAEGDDL